MAIPACSLRHEHVSEVQRARQAITLHRRCTIPTGLPAASVRACRRRRRPSSGCSSLFFPRRCKQTHCTGGVYHALRRGFVRAMYVLYAVQGEAAGVQRPAPAADRGVSHTRIRQCSVHMTALETSSRTIHACLTTAKAIALFHSSAAQAAVVQLSAATGGRLVSSGSILRVARDRHGRQSDSKLRGTRPRCRSLYLWLHGCILRPATSAARSSHGGIGPGRERQ